VTTNLGIRVRWVIAEFSNCTSWAGVKTTARSRARQFVADMRLTASVRKSTVSPDTRSLLIIDHTLPDPSQDAGSDRLVRIARMAARLGYDTKVLGYADRQLVGIEDTSPDDLSLPPSVTPTDAVLTELVERAGTIWISRPEVAGRLMPSLSRLREGRRFVFDTVDLHYLRLSRQAKVSSSNQAARSSAAYRQLERHLLRTADCTVVVTPQEARALQTLEPAKIVAVIPTVQGTRITPVPPRADRSGLIFIGNYRHPPNVDAVRQLIEQIMPALWKELPGTTLTVVGNRLPPEIAAGLDSRITVAGWVEDLGPIVDGAVALAAPLRFGAGMNGKLCLAMAHGLPVVTTNLGAEGLDLVDGQNALVADDPEAFVHRCEHLITDAAQWAQLSETGKIHIDANYSVQALMQKLEDVLARP